MHEILESDDLEKALKESDQKPPTLFSAHITNEQPPNFETIVDYQPA